MLNKREKKFFLKAKRRNNGKNMFKKNPLERIIAQHPFS